MGRWQRIATTVLALTVTGVAVPAAVAAEAAEPAVQIAFTTQPRVTFSEGLTSATGTKGALATASWSVSRPAEVTVRALDASGAVVKTLAQAVAVADAYDVSWSFVDAAGHDVPEGDYTLRVEAVDTDGNRDVDDYALPLDRHTVVPLQGVTSGETFGTNATMSVSPRPGVTLTSARFVVGDDYAATCAVSESKGPGFGGRIQTTFNVSDCGASNRRAGSFFEFTDRIGAKQTGYTATVPVRIVDRTAPVAQIAPDSTAADTLALRDVDHYETSDIAYAVREAGEIASATYDIRNALGARVATGELVNTGLTATDHTWQLELRWDGTRNDGTRLAAGRYRVSTRFTDLAGLSDSGPAATVTLDPTIPGTLAVPPVESYRWQVVVTPKAGAGVTGVTVSTAPAGEDDPAPTTLPYDGATGTYRTVLSLAGRPAGTYPLRALITRGTAPGTTTFTTADQELVLAADTEGPVVTAPANDRLYLVFSTQYTAGTFTFGVSDQSAVTSSDFVVSDAEGTVVDHAVGAGGEGITAFTWDGTGPDGARLPGGDYVVRTTFTDAAGNATAASATVHLDDTVPGTLTATAAGDNKFTFELTPTPGVTVQAAGVAMIGSSCCNAAMERDPATGRFRVTVDLASRPDGRYRFSSLVARNTPGATDKYGWFWTDPVIVTVSH